jgi:nitrogen fixation protein FixH
MFSDARPLTGRAVLAITLAAFGTIIAANVTLAVYAIGTFPGLEVANTYVASQTFDADARAQQALGWTATVEEAGGRMTLRLVDRTGAPVRPRDLTVLATRPTEAREDTPVTLTFDGTDWTGPAALPPGRWRIRIAAMAPDGTAFRTIRDLTVRAAP